MRRDKVTDIYVCGGGQFASWLLDNQKNDVLKLKINPLILGEEIKLFGQSVANHKLQLVDTSNYENGLQIMKNNVIYDKEQTTNKPEPLRYCQKRS